MAQLRRLLGDEALEAAKYGGPLAPVFVNDADWTRSWLAWLLAADTAYTDKFVSGWPDAPHRVLRSALEAAEAFKGDVVGEALGPDGASRPIRRF